MACLEMYNPDQHKGGHCPPMSPRISFSNDFVDTHQMIAQERSSREAPVSSDFEFSVTNYSMMSADELFFKGRLLPFKDNFGTQMQRTTTTLRDELLLGDEEENVFLRPPRGSARWKGLLGLKKTHTGSKKAERSDGTVEKVGNSKRPALDVQEDMPVGKPSQLQELLDEGGSSCRDVDVGL